MLKKVLEKYQNLTKDLKKFRMILNYKKKKIDLSSIIKTIKCKNQTLI